MYSNNRPWGNGTPPRYDCSSAVIEALMSSGYFNYESKIGWTGSLHDSILPKITKSIERKECGPGDIFLSNWSSYEGHTGIFLSNDKIIHCNAQDMTITTTEADGRMGKEPYKFYRLISNISKNSEKNFFHYYGVFYPNTVLPVSADTDPNSPPLSFYEVGMKINYDSYLFDNGYAWISYVSQSGIRRYVAVGPDDGKSDTVWGKGFFN